MGIRLRSTKSLPLEESDEATAHFDVLLDFSEIHVRFGCLVFPLKTFFSVVLIVLSVQLLREDRTSTLEIMRIAAVASFDVPMQVGQLSYPFSCLMIVYSINSSCLFLWDYILVNSFKYLKVARKLISIKFSIKSL